MLIHDMFPSSLAPFRSPGTAACASPLQGVAHVRSAHRVFGEMPESLETSRAGHGVASAHKTVYWKEGAPQDDANQVLDAMPSTGLGADLNIGQVLSVTVHRMIYPLTLSVLHQVFGAYGMVLKLSAVGKLVCCQVVLLVSWNTCMADLMLTAVGGGSLFLEFDMDLSVPSAHEVFPDKLPWKCSAFSPWSNNAFSSGYNGMQSRICFSPKQRWSGSCCNTIFIRNFMVLFQSVDHGVSLTLPWDPGDVVCIPIVETFYIFSSTGTDPRHFRYRILLKCTGLFSEHNLYQLIKTHVQKYNCGLVVRIESAAMYQQLIWDPGGSVFQFAESEPSGIIVRSWVQWDPGGLHFSICLVVYDRDPEADDSTCYFHMCNNTKPDGMACDPSGCFKLLLRNDCCRTSELRY